MQRNRLSAMGFADAIYSAREAAAITKVTTDTQRLWRKRGFLPANQPGRYARFNAGDLGYLLALRGFSEAGVGLKEAAEAASAASLPVIDFVELLSTEEDEEELTKVDRFIISKAGRSFRARTLDKAIGFFDQDADEAHIGDMAFLVFDCRRAAELILQRAPRPPFTIIEEGGSDV